MVTMHISKPIWEGEGFKNGINPMDNHPYTIDQFFPAYPVDLKQIYEGFSSKYNVFQNKNYIKKFPSREEIPPLRANKLFFVSTF